MNKTDMHLPISISGEASNEEEFVFVFGWNIFRAADGTIPSSGDSKSGCGKRINEKSGFPTHRVSNISTCCPFCTDS